jgi:hypothetical protein
LIRIPAIVEQDLKAGIRDEAPKPPHLGHASPRAGDRRHPETLVAEHLMVQAHTEFTFAKGIRNSPGLGSGETWLAAFPYGGDAFVNIIAPFQRRPKLIGEAASRREAGRLPHSCDSLRPLGRQGTVLGDRSRHFIERRVNAVSPDDTIDETDVLHFLSVDFPARAEQLERAPHAND